ASGIDPVDAVRALGARVHHVHVKDIGDPTALAGHRALARALEVIGFAGRLSAEVEVHDDQERLRAVAGSRAWLDEMTAVGAAS
ncbi:MAG: hypothetical protein H0W83_09480, partial [Planctomycetes bacterium]|nr:hypothetical protein [Planctomycetota bacterium]